MPAEDHPVFKPPTDFNIPIWRYMDFTKFVSMLENRGLFFSRADKLGDPFEGSYSHGNKKLRPEVYKDPEIPSSVFDQIFLSMGRYAYWLRSWVMVNCWHMNQYESAAMWNLYAKTNEAISIRSTFSKLRDLLDSDCYIGIVRYIDYDTDWIFEGNAFYPYIHKRKSFSHEQEVRAVINMQPKDGLMQRSPAQPPEGGIWKSVDLDQLVDHVYIAPTASSWFRELVEQVIVRYSLRSDVSQSKLDEEPFF
jgi:hypothetical protein